MGNLEATRVAFANHDWTRAHDGFTAAAAEALLAADDLASLREASWWLGLLDESLVAAEKADRRYLEASDKSSRGISGLGDRVREVHEGRRGRRQRVYRPSA